MLMGYSMKGWRKKDNYESREKNGHEEVIYEFKESQCPIDAIWFSSSEWPSLPDEDGVREWLRDDDREEDDEEEGSSSWD